MLKILNRHHSEFLKGGFGLMLGSTIQNGINKISTNIAQCSKADEYGVQSMFKTDEKPL